jgi:hypothetical protein
MSVKIMVEVCPTPAETASAEPKPQKLSVEDKVRHALDLIESGHTSRVEWKMINGLYTELKKMKPSPRVSNLIDMIKPVLAKFGYHDVGAK